MHSVQVPRISQRLSVSSFFSAFMKFETIQCKGAETQRKFWKIVNGKCYVFTLMKQTVFILKLLLFIGCFVALERFCHKQTRGFSISNIYSLDEKACTASPLSLDVEKILAQRFHFLDSGLECYAFVSEDGKWVLKTFKQHHAKNARLLLHLPLPAFFQRSLREKETRLNNSFESLKVASEELKEETGLLYVHLGKSSNLNRSVTLVDKLGIVHTVALDSLDFFLQKRADLLIPTLSKLMQEGRVEEAKASISSLLELIVTRSKKGIADRDPTLTKNFGFIGTQAVVIDVGSFSKNPFLTEARSYKQALFYETLPLRCLLAKEHPILLAHFEKEMHTQLTE